MEMMGGPSSIFTYNHELLSWAAAMLAERWGTELLVPIEKCSTMACIRCPLEAWDAEGVDLFKLIWDRFHIVVPLITMPVRTSAKLPHLLSVLMLSCRCRPHLSRPSPGQQRRVVLRSARAPAGGGGLVGADLGADLQRA